MRNQSAETGVLNVNTIDMSRKASKFVPVGSAEIYYSLAELSSVCEMKFDLLSEFVDNNIIYADGPAENMYSKIQLTRLQTACRLMNCFELDTSAAPTALALFERIEQLERRVNWLQFACLEVANSTVQ